MAECRCGQVDVALDITGRGAAFTSLNHVPKDREPDRMAQGSELLGVTFQLRWHALLLILSKEAGKGYFQKYRTTRQVRDIIDELKASAAAGCGLGERLTVSVQVAPGVEFAFT